MAETTIHGSHFGINHNRYEDGSRIVLFRHILDLENWMSDEAIEDEDHIINIISPKTGIKKRFQREYRDVESRIGEKSKKYIYHYCSTEDDEFCLEFYVPIT